MTSKTTCSICCEDFTSKKFVQCMFCKFDACVTCCKTFLLDSDEPKCMSCGAHWNSTFMQKSFPATFLNKDYRKHEKNILLRKELSLLPQTQEAARAARQKKEDDILRKKTSALGKEIELLRQMLNICVSCELELPCLCESDDDGFLACVFCREQERFFEVGCQFFDWVPPSGYETRREFIKKKYTEVRRAKRHRTDEYLAETVLKRPRVSAPKEETLLFLCPGESCRGYITSGLCCSICEKKACADCREFQGKDHVCDLNAVETVNLLKKDTKPCPKCMVPIHKIYGCDQMFCTGCHVTFSWQKGTITRGEIHNPHYFEWMAERGERGLLDYEELEAIGECEEPLDEHELYIYHYFLKNLTTCPPATAKKFISNLIMGYRHINAHIALPRENNEDLRIRFLNQEITEETLGNTAQKRKKAFDMRHEIYLIHDMVLHVFHDHLVTMRKALNLEDEEQLFHLFEDMRKAWKMAKTALEDTRKRFKSKNSFLFWLPDIETM